MCQFCKSAVAEEATKCAACGSNIGDIKVCPGCAEPVRTEAVTCPFCSADLRPPSFDTSELEAEPWVIVASPIGAAIMDQSFTALIYPPILTVSPGEIHIRRRQFIGLRTLDQKLSVSRIASVRAVDGVIWGALIVETYGGASGDLAIGGLDKDEARRTAALVEQIAHLKSGGDSGRSNV